MGVFSRAGACFCILLFLSAAAGAATLDQSQENYSGASRLLAQYRHAQTFTPSIIGKLDSIWLWSNNVDRSFQTTITILTTTAGGAPDQTLASASFRYGDYSTWFPIDLASKNLQLLAGHKYAFAVTSNDPFASVYPYGNEIGINWEGNLYPGGELWRSDSGGPWVKFNAFGTPGDSDMMFRTYMIPSIVPEPFAASMIPIAAAFLLTWRRRKSRS